MSINLLYNPFVLDAPYTQGYVSYLQDALGVVEKDSLPVSINSTEFHKFTILFHQIAKPAFIRGYTPDYVVRVLHSGVLELPEVDFKFFSKEKLIYITQYKEQCEYFKSEGLNCHYLPMRINTQNITSSASKNGKWIYFGNVYENKKNILETLKNFISFDTLSYSQLNGEGDVLTHTECLELVSQYSYGIGVGRCALEMSAMGLPVLIAGKAIGGTLVTEEDLNFHSNYNCNGDGSNSTTLEEDIQKVINTPSTISKDSLQLDLNNWINILNSYT